jgi:hypothetical protein
MKIKNYKKYYQKKRYRHLRKKRSIFRNRFFWFSILGVVIFAGLFYLFIFSPVFQIRAITVQGTHFIDALAIEKETKRIAAKKILFFPTKSIFVFDKKWAKQLILEKFLPCKDVIIKKVLANRLSIDIRERKPRAVVFEQDDYFLVDKEGLIFWKTDKETASFNKPFIRTEGDVRLGETIISKEILDFVCLADTQLSKEAGIEISEFFASPTKIEAKVSDENWSIYFGPQKDLDIQIEDLILVLKNQISPRAVAEGEEVPGEGALGEGGEEPDERERQELFENLHYIDLRFDKVFYK